MKERIALIASTAFVLLLVYTSLQALGVVG